MLDNNFQRIAKKYIFDLLKENYQRNEEMVNRSTHYLITEKEVKDFCQMIADAWYSGYKEAIDQYKGKLEELGYEVNIAVKN